MELSEYESIIGVDLGGTKVAAGKIAGNRLTGTVQKLIPALSKNRQDILDIVIEVIEAVFDESTVAIGIGIPGLTDSEKGIIYDVQNIPSWKEVKLKQILEERFRVPVYLDNDANCYVLGELFFGAGKGCSDFVGLTLGTGMGAGIIKNGVLLSGAHGGAGEFGNIPYLNSIYEDYCSGKFFLKTKGIKGEVLLEAAKNSDPFALKAFEEFGFHLGNAVKTILFAVDPRKIIIGGSVAQAAPYFKTQMWKSLLDFPFKSALKGFDVLFSNVQHIAVLGAASLCLMEQQKTSDLLKTN